MPIEYAWGNEGITKRKHLDFSREHKAFDKHPLINYKHTLNQW